MPLVLTHYSVTFDDISYSRDVEVPVNKLVICRINVRAEYPRVLGLIVARLNAYFEIRVNGETCTSRYNRKFTDSDITDGATCTLKMPNKKTTVTFLGGHEEKGKWVEDFRKVITLSPPPPPAAPPPPKLPPVAKECTQWFKVVDERGSPIGGAIVITTGIGKVFTGADGRSSFKLVEGLLYTARAEKEGYVCVTCEKTFTACTKEIVLTLKKVAVAVPPVKECTQSVKVVDEKWTPIGGVAVIVVGIGKRFTGVDGKASFKLEIDREYTVKAEKEGYECVDCRKVFTACTPEIVLTLKAKIAVAPPVMEVCTQVIGVVDEKGLPIGGADVRVVGIGKKFTGVDGKASFKLEKGKEHTVKVEKEGYTCVDCERTFTACAPEIILTLKKAIEKEVVPRPIQSFIVVDEKGNPLRATITLLTNKTEVDRVEAPKWSKRLEAGKEYTVKAEKNGYVTAEEAFTAPAAEIKLVLKTKI